MSRSLSLVFPLVLVFVLATDAAKGGVLELDGNKFLELRNQRNWLLKFYAPWCGYCKRLAPVWDQVGEALSYSGSNLTVAKLDATRFGNVAREFDIHGFPTIIFVKGEQVYTHHGGRTLEDIVEFAERAKGPAVRRIKSVSQFSSVADARKLDTFYLYVGPEQHPNFEKYKRVAEDRILQGYFYAVGNKDLLSTNTKRAVRNLPDIMVIKDTQHIHYQGEDGSGSDSPLEWSALKKWVGKERYPPFLKLSSSNIGEVASTADWLVIGMLDLSVSEDHPLNTHIKTVVKGLSERQRQRFPGCQFAWTVDADMVDTIMMWNAAMPGVMIFESSSHLYYLVDTPVETLQTPHLADHIYMAINGRSTARGGNSFSRKILRVFYQTFTGIIGLFREHPVMASLITLVPGAIISFMVYLICCGGLVDDDEAECDEDEDEDAVARREEEDAEREQGEETEGTSGGTQHLKSE